MRGCGVDNEGRWRCMAVILDGIRSCFRLFQDRSWTTRRSDCLDVHGRHLFQSDFELDTAPDRALITLPETHLEGHRTALKPSPA